MWVVGGMCIGALLWYFVDFLAKKQLEMNSDQMMQFKAIAECGNITKASERLYVTQPSLSHMLKKLEEELGCQLFDRVSNKIVLNKNGQKLLKYCNRMAKVIDDMYKDFSREEADKNTIVIKSYVSIQAMIIRYSTFDSETPIKISNIHDFDSVPDIFSQCDVVIASDAYSLNKAG